MMTFGTSAQPAEPGDHAEVAVAGRLSRRDSIESLALLVGMFGILLGLTLTMGASIVIGQ